MHSTLKLRDSDPHDDFAIAPDVVPAAWADKVLADISRDADSAAKSPPDIKRRPDIKRPVSDQPRHPGIRCARRRGGAIRRYDVSRHRQSPTYRPRPNLLRPAGGQKARSCWCLRCAALPQPPPGNTTAMRRKQMISAWVPAFALTSSPPRKTLRSPRQTDTPAAQATAAEQPPRHRQLRLRRRTTPQRPSPLPPRIQRSCS